MHLVLPKSMQWGNHGPPRPPAAPNRNPAAASCFAVNLESDMNHISRNQREGQYFGIYRGRHRRVGQVNFDHSNHLPYEVTEQDFKATRKEQRQHKKNRSFIRRLHNKGG